MMELDEIAQLAEPEMTSKNWADFEDTGSGYQPPPPEGMYLLRMPEIQIPENIGKDYNNRPQLEFSPVIVDGPFEGREVRFQRAGTSKLGQYNVTPAHKLLRACKYEGTPPSSTDHWLVAFKQLSNRVFPAYLTWLAKDKGADGQQKAVYIRGANKFPTDENGVPVPVIDRGTYQVRAYPEINWFRTGDSK